MTGGEKYITNLYFVFLLEMRALVKIESFLVNQVNWQSSGDTSLTRDAIKNLLKVVRYVQVILPAIKGHFLFPKSLKQKPSGFTSPLFV
jgi:hypothetical protein